MDTVVFWARRQIALINISRDTDKDQPLLTGQTGYVIPLIFLPEGSDATLMCLEYCIYLFILARQPPVDQVLLIHEVSRSHTTTHHSR